MFKNSLFFYSANETNRINSFFFLNFFFKFFLSNLFRNFSDNSILTYFTNNNVFINYSKSSFYFLFSNFCLDQKMSIFSNAYNFFNINRYSLKRNTLKKKYFVKKCENWFLKNHNLSIFYKTAFFINPIFYKFNSSLPLSRFYFKKLKYKKFNPNFFKLNKLDWLSETMAKLTKYSSFLNSNDYLIFKSIFFKKYLISFFNRFYLINKNYENNYYYFNMKTELNLHSQISNKTSFFNKFNTNFFYSYTTKKKNTSKEKNIFNSFNFILLFYFSPLFFKYFLTSNFSINNEKAYFKRFPILKNIFFLKDFFFNFSSTQISSNNLIPDLNFNFSFKKKMLKIFNYSKFPTITTIWHYNTLVRFLEFCSGKKVFIKFFNFLITTLTFSEKAQCLIWAQKVKYFRKVLGPRLFLNESLQLMYLSLKLKDPFIFTNWMISTMYKISFWKYKTFLRYIKYVLRYFFWVIFKDLKIKGVKFQLKGKISVAGNARTRTVFHNVGFTSHTTFNNKILYNLNLVRSFTGVMSLKLWIVF